MENIRKNIGKWIERLDKRWEEMPLVNQHKFILCFFAGYTMLTAAVIFKVWHDRAKNQSSIVIDHIDRPLTTAQSINNAKKENL